ncbi:MAG: hypothetical protein QNJ97_20355 [Myxococcota bacterium]|nr:hypothetical protein [Myxococcota bacterium]
MQTSKTQTHLITISIVTILLLLPLSQSHAAVVDCESFDGIVDEDITFSSACTFHGQVKIAKSDVTLDCNGGTIDGRTADRTSLLQGGTGPKSYGIVVLDPDDLDPGNNEIFPETNRVTIKNCTVQYFSKGIVLERQGPGIDDGAGKHPRHEWTHLVYRDYHFNNEPATWDEYQADLRDAQNRMYEKGIKNLLISNTLLSKTGFELKENENALQ